MAYSTMVRIDVIRRRLADEHGITFRWQGGGIIRGVYSEPFDAIVERQMHYTVASENEAAASEAWRVLRDGERLADRWGGVENL